MPCFVDIHDKQKQEEWIGGWEKSGMGVDGDWEKREGKLARM